MRICLAILAIAVAATPALGADPGLVPYPEGYRDWRHLKSMVIQEGHPLFGAFGGIHHLYANELALEGYRTGRFPEGSIIVFDLLSANAADAAIVEGPRKVVGVMHKDSARWAATGGWGFEGFAGDSKTERAVGTDAATACFSCHAPRKDSDYVFSQTRS